MRKLRLNSAGAEEAFVATGGTVKLVFAQAELIDDLNLDTTSQSIVDHSLEIAGTQGEIVGGEPFRVYQGVVKSGDVYNKTKEIKKMLLNRGIVSDSILEYRKHLAASSANHLQRNGSIAQNLGLLSKTMNSIELGAEGSEPLRSLDDKAPESKRVRMAKWPQLSVNQFMATMERKLIELDGIGYFKAAMALDSFRAVNGRDATQFDVLGKIFDRGIPVNLGFWEKFESKVAVYGMVDAKQWPDLLRNLFIANLIKLFKGDRSMQVKLAVSSCVIFCRVNMASKSVSKILTGSLFDDVNLFNSGIDNLEASFGETARKDVMSQFVTTIFDDSHQGSKL